MGLTFKENCPDLRNSRVVDVIRELIKYHCNIEVYDPWVNKDESKDEYGIVPVSNPEQGKYDAILLAVSHNQFKEMGVDKIRSLGKENHVVYDVKNILPIDAVDGRL